jgi:hypothetical protein
MSELLAMHAAAHNVELYEQHAEKIISDHHEAMECLDCQAFLQLGIDAFRWLVSTDEIIVKAVAEGIAEYDADLESKLDELFRRWLVPCDFANEWVDVQLKRGYQPDNLRKFRKCQAEARAIVKSIDITTRQMSDSLIDLRDEAIEEHRRGETAEFI